MIQHAETIATANPAATLPLDGEGFLVAGAAWTRESAGRLAALHGVDKLGDAHWLVIDYIRAYYERFGVAPLMRRVCRTHGLAASDMKSLFPDCLTAWRIAGLPNPGEEAKAYMSRSVLHAPGRAQTGTAECGSTRTA